MNRLTIRKYKYELQQNIVTIPSGKRHKDFDYPTFSNLKKEWEINSNTPLETKEMRTAICFAGDVRKNFVGYYILQKIKKDYAICTSLENEGQQCCFYLDSVALIPLEIIPSKIKLKLLRSDDILEMDRQQRKRRKKL